MRSQFNGRRRTSAALGILLALVVAGGAFAYWTISGSGTGSASAGTAATPLVVEQQSAVLGMYPGMDWVAVPVAITNPNSSPVMVADLSAALVSTTNEPGCTIADFEVSGPVPLNTTIGANASLPNSGLYVRMRETGVNQDACQGETVNLSFSVSVP